MFIDGLTRLQSLICGENANSNQKILLCIILLLESLLRIVLFFKWMMVDLFMEENRLRASKGPSEGPLGITGRDEGSGHIGPWPFRESQKEDSVGRTPWWRSG